MLVKLLPDQIAKYWDYIKYAAQNGVAGGEEISPSMVQNALENLLADTMQCWWLVTAQENGDEPTLHCIVVTSPLYDNVTRKSTLRICYAFGFTDMSKELWLDMLMTLINYAKAKGYAGIDALTDNPDILRAGGLFKVQVLQYIYHKLED